MINMVHECEILKEQNKEIEKRKRYGERYRKEIKTLNARCNRLEYELTCLDGLHVSDNKDMTNAWRLDFKELLEDKEKQGSAYYACNIRFGLFAEDEHDAVTKVRSAFSDLNNGTCEIIISERATAYHFKSRRD